MPQDNFKSIVCIVSNRRIEKPASSSCPHEATEKISYPRWLIGPRGSAREAGQ